MGKDDLFFLGIVGFFGGLFLFWKGFGWLRQKQLIENMPTSKVRSLAMGLVEVYGEVIPFQKTLSSPFSNNSCVYYRYTVEEYCRSGKHNQWVTIKQGSDSVPFYLKDDTGAVLVDPNGAQVDIPSDFVFRSDFGLTLSQQVKDFLKKNNLSYQNFFGMNKTMRCTEYFLAPQDNVYVFGTAGDNPFVEEATAVQGFEDIMIQKGRQGFYYISDKPERAVLSDLHFKVLGGIFGGAALSVICLIIILFYLKLL